MQLIESLTRKFFFNFSAVLMLHRVVEKSNTFLPSNRGLEISANYFERLIISLLDHGFEFKALDQLGKGQNRSIYLTFDDGYMDNLSVAYPILRKYNIPFAIFVNTAFVSSYTMPWWYFLDKELSFAKKYTFNNDHYDLFSIEDKENLFMKIRNSVLHNMSKDEDIFKSTHPRAEDLFLGWMDLQLMLDEGLLTICNHTHDHCSLSNWNHETKKSFTRCHEIIKEKFDLSIHFFAPPYGVFPDGADFEEYLLRMNYSFCFGTSSGLLPKNIEANRFKIPRINVTEGLNLFKLFGRKNILMNLIG